MNFKRFHESKNLWSFGNVSIAVGERLKTFDISLPSNTYTIKAKYSSTNTGSVTIGIYDENEQIHTYNTTQIDGTVSCSYTGIITAIRFYAASGYSPSASYSAEFTEVILNEGETALPYEPYSSEVWHDIPHYIMGTDTDTITTLPADLYADGQSASANIIGNMNQQGTPTPSSIIMPSETGKRTAQLWDEEYLNGYYNSSNTFVSANNQFCSKSKIAVKPNTAYWLGVYSASTSAFLGVLKYNENAEFIERVNTETYKGDGVVFTTDASTYYININFGAYYGAVYNDDIIIAESSTPISYEPYGYKIPILSNSTTTPVYLGEVESTRRIKKLVLTGGEANWRATAAEPSGRNRFYLPLANAMTSDTSTPRSLCSHLPLGANGATYSTDDVYTITNSNIYIRLTVDYNSLSDFQTYLQQQYSAGTPVCVWYVLATPETAVVNEPLRKIGDYADTVSGITIPTIAGANTLSIGTTLQPSEVTATYKGWHPVADVHEYRGGWN